LEAIFKLVFHCYPECQEYSVLVLLVRAWGKEVIVTIVIVLSFMYMSQRKHLVQRKELILCRCQERSVRWHIMTFSYRPITLQIEHVTDKVPLDVEKRLAMDG